MAQNYDDILAGDSISDMRPKVIDRDDALKTFFSGLVEPDVSIREAYMYWADTTLGLLKQRNSANDAWIVIGRLGQTYLGALAADGSKVLEANLDFDSNKGVNVADPTASGDIANKGWVDSNRPGQYYASAGLSNANPCAFTLSESNGITVTTSTTLNVLNAGLYDIEVKGYKTGFNGVSLTVQKTNGGTVTLIDSGSSDGGDSTFGGRRLYRFGAGDTIQIARGGGGNIIGGESASCFVITFIKP